MSHFLLLGDEPTIVRSLSSLDGKTAALRFVPEAIEHFLDLLGVQPWLIRGSPYRNEKKTDHSTMFWRSSSSANSSTRHNCPV